MRFLVIILVLLGGVLPACQARSAALLERGAAITDPLALRELDRGRFGLGHVLMPMRSADAPITNSQLFAQPSMVPVRKALDDEFERYVASHKAGQPGETIGVGGSYDLQLFDRTLLYSPDSRFVLAGIVNRMDRAYLTEANCGEIRLIYRLTRTDGPRGWRCRDLAAPADDAQSRAEGQRRSRDRPAMVLRSPAPKSRGAGWRWRIPR